MRTKGTDNPRSLLWRAVHLVLAGLAWAAVGPATAAVQAAAPVSRAPQTQVAASRPITIATDGAPSRHILKRFDFDERKFGNLEDIPMYWTRRKGLNLPHYNTGSFDRSSGHDGPPSFRLACITESVAYTYDRNDIPVEPGNRYTVSGWIRTEGLRKSRAYLSASYLARDLGVIEQAETESPGIGQAEQDGHWHYVELQTAEAPRTARWLRITVWLAQPETADDLSTGRSWNRTPAGPRGSTTSR